MSWQQWVLVAWLAWIPLLNIWLIGKPREPITPENALWIVVIYAGLLACAITA